MSANLDKYDKAFQKGLAIKKNQLGKKPSESTIEVEAEEIK